MGVNLRMLKRFLIGVFLALLMLTVQVFATDYYVRIDGSDLNCNGLTDVSEAFVPDCAFRTVQKGINLAISPRDIVNVRGDHSNEGLLSSRADGCIGGGCITNPTYITIQTTPGANQYSGIISPGIQLNHNYLIVNGLGITGSYCYSCGTAGITFGWSSSANYNQVTNNHFYNPATPIGSAAILFGDSSHYNIVSDNLIEGDTNPLRVTGHHTGATGTTLTDSYYSWDINQWQGRKICDITAGGYGCVSAGIVLSNDANSITTSIPITWNTGDCYVIGTSYWIPFVIAGSNNIIRNNTIRNLANTERVFDGIADYTIISGNEVSDLLNGNALPNGIRPTIDNCEAHPDIFQIWNSGSINVTIENNYFHDLQSQTGILEGNGHNFSDWIIRNNVFANIMSRQTINSPDFKWYNNVFFNVAQGVNQNPLEFWFTGVEYKNNIIIGGSTNPDYGMISALLGDMVECAKNVITKTWLSNTDISTWIGQGGTQAILTANGFVYIGTGSGLTGGSPPNWISNCPNINDTCVDNGITWTNTLWNTYCKIIGTKDVLFGNKWGYNRRNNVTNSFICDSSAVDGGDPRIYDAEGTKTCKIKNSSEIPASNNYYGIWDPPAYSPRTLSRITKIYGDMRYINGGDPRFVAAYKDCINNICDFHLRSDSPLINKGIDLSGSWTGAEDKDGVTRPQGSAWDIGAYEFVNGTLPTTICILSSAEWSKNSTVEGTQIILTTRGVNCDGTTVSFEVREDDGILGWDPVNINPANAVISNGVATITWIAEWQVDQIGNPEYYFIATESRDSANFVKSSNQLSVSKGTSTISKPVCGNDITEPGEACDGIDLAGVNDCSYLPGFVGGSLSCKRDCSGWDISSCVAGNTINAASCSQADVQAAIDSVSGGDTVNVPAGSCTWNNAVTFTNKDVVVKGEGIDKTIIHDGTGSGWGQTLFWITGIDGKSFRITGFTFDGTGMIQDSNGIIKILGTSKTFRIDHNKFLNPFNRAIWVGHAPSLTQGIVDDNIFKGDIAFNAVLVDGDNVNSWNTPLGFGTNNYVFVEDNIVNFTSTIEGNAAVDGAYGARFVFRNNNVINAIVGNHGTCANDGHSTHSMEIYNNTLSTDGASLFRAFGSIRGGTAVIYNNIITGSYTHPIQVTNYRTCYNNGTTICSVGGWDRCDGTSSNDGNTGILGYPCLDQIGRSTDVDGDGQQDLEPMYEWNNLFNGADADIEVYNFDGCANPSVNNHIQEGRDYYNDLKKPGYVPYPYPHPLTQIDNIQPTTQCSDNVDNDGDGSIDLADFGCSSLTDNNEINNGATECSNGLDDDVDGFIDQDDSDCGSRNDNSEAAFVGVAYYVRAGATGNNDGSDWTNAYTSLPATLERGTTYYIADGTYGGYIFDDAENGTQYITIKKATIAYRGTDTGWISTYGDGQAVFRTGTTSSAITFRTSYLILDGVKGIGKDALSYGFRVEVSDCTNRGGYQPDKAQMVTFEQNNLGYIELKHLEIENCGFGGGAYDYEQNNIYSNPYSSINNITLANNYLHNSGHNILMRNWIDSIIEHNYFENVWSSTANHGESISSADDTNIILRNNYFENINGTAHVSFGKSISGASHPDYGWQIYNNIHLGGIVGNGVYASDTISGFYDTIIYGNTFISINTCSFYTGQGSNNTAYNNIFYNCSVTAFNNINHDYNLFDDNDHGESNAQVWSGGNGLFMNYANDDFRLAQPTNAGLTLSSPYNIDMDGNIRGADGVWDIGAYESPYSSGPICDPNTYYIDFESGYDFNAGNCTNSAFKHAPGDSNAVGVAASTSLQPGDTVKFKGGINYYGSIELRYVGDSINPITYSGDSWPGFEGIKASIDGSVNLNNAWNSYSGNIFQTTLSKPAYIILEDGNMLFPQETLSNLDKPGEYFMNSSSNILYLWSSDSLNPQTHSLRMSDLDFAFKPANSVYINYVTLNGFNINYVNGYASIDLGKNYYKPHNNIKIINCHINGGVSSGIYIRNGANEIIENCTIENIVSYGSIAVTFYDSTNITIKNSEIKNIRNDNLRIQSSNNVIVENNVIHNNTYGSTHHPDLIQLTAASGIRNDGVIIDNNILYNGGTLGIMASGSDNVLLKNNVVYNTAGTATDWGYDNNNLSVYNNVILGSLRVWGSSQGDSDNIKIYNNILLSAMPCKRVTNLQSDNNIYLTKTTMSGYEYQLHCNNQSDYGPINISQYTSKTGNGEHSLAIHNFEELFLDYNLSNFNLKQSSPAIDAGADLSAYFTTDKDGVTRPQGNAWDIGAYEFVNGSTPPPPPIPCVLTGASWDVTNVVEGSLVGLSVTGTGCNGKTLSFEVWEDDGILGRDPVNLYPRQAVFSGGFAQTIWTAEWQSDQVGNPEYYFIATQVDNTSNAIQSSNRLSVSKLGQITFNNLLPLHNSQLDSPVNFSVDVSSSNRIREISLMANFSGTWQTENTWVFNSLGSEMLTNGNFESFNGNLATNWNMNEDGTIAYTLSQDTGVTGLAQKVDVTSAGTWGLFYYQTPAMQLGHNYTWTLQYKTSGTKSISASITDGPHTHVVLDNLLQGTNNKWQFIEFNFTYTDNQADELRVSSEQVGSFWIDSFSLREVTADLSTTQSISVQKTLTNGNYKWAFQASDGSTVLSGERVVNVGVVQSISPTPLPSCGNDITEPGEACDGIDLAGVNDCSYLPGFVGGSLSCKRDCSGWDISSCVAGNTINAASCSQADVQAAIDSASDGDTVNVPAGSCVWFDKVLIIDKSIVLKGSGFDKTSVDDQTIGGFEQQAIIISANNSHANRITGFKFLEHNRLPQEYNGQILVKGGTIFRIDNNVFEGSDVRCIAIEYGRGVINNNNFTKMRGPSITTDYQKDFWGDYSWSTPTTLGEFTDGMIFVENNTFAWDESLRNSGEHHDSIIDNGFGSRWVVRNNIAYDTAIMSHGINGGGRGRGLRQFELYNNKIISIPELNRNGGIYGLMLRGGTGVAFNNSLEGPMWQYFVKMNLDMERTPESYPNAITAWGANLCNGTTSPYSAPGGYPCLDQVGAGQDEGVWSGNPATPMIYNNQQLEPVYFWSNTRESGYDNYQTTSTKIQEGRDFFWDVKKPGYVPYPYPHPLTQIDNIQPTTQCSDNVDNDGDGSIDLADFGCSSLTDNNEINNGATECSNGLDDDVDGFIDQDDSDCGSRNDNSEAAFVGVAYYVRAGATGNNDGSDWTNAWQSFANINWGSIQPGDYVYISGGIYNENLVIGADGTSGNFITIKRATNGDHGINVGWDTSFDSLVIITDATIDLRSRSFITIDGSIKNGIKLNGSAYWGWTTKRIFIGSDTNSYSEYITIQNVEIEGNGRFQCEAPQGIAVGGNFVRVDNLHINNVTVHEFSGAALRMGDHNNLTIENSVIYNVQNPSAEQCLIETGIPNNNPHNTHIALYGTQESSNIVIKNNLFYQDYDDNIVNSGYAVGFGYVSGNVDIYNNVFYNIAYSMLTAENPMPTIPGSEINIYGNTFVGYRISLSFNQGSSFNVANNIFCNNGFDPYYTRYAYSESLSVLDSNNLFCYDSRYNYPYGTNGIVLSDGEDPFININGADFRLKNGTQAIDAGTDLGPPYNIDLEGNPRPQGFAWDIGAYESPYSVLIPTSCSDVNILCVDDTTGSTQEYSTIQSAVNVAVAGDTVLIYPGVYDERVIVSNSGTFGNKILIRAESSGVNVLKGFLVKGNNVKIDGLDITNTNVGENPKYDFAGIAIYGNSVEIKDNFIHNVKGVAIWTQEYPVSNWINDLQIINNTIQTVIAGMWISATNYLVDGNDISNLTRFPTVGFDNDYTRFFGENGVYRNNYFHDTLHVNTGSSHVDCFQTYGNNGAWAKNIIFENNMCFGFFHQGFMAESTGVPEFGNITVRNNIFGSGSAWIAVAAISHFKFYNNVFYNTSPIGIGFRVGGGYTGFNGEIINNIFYDVGRPWSTHFSDIGNPYIATNNLVYLSSENYNPTYSVGGAYSDYTNDMRNQDPLFVNPSDPLGPDGVMWTADDGFRLQAGSPAIGAGVGGVDIGAYESPYSSIVSIPEIKPPPPKIQQPVCGNSIIEAGEVCDRINLDGLICSDMPGRSSGNLHCNPDCLGYNLLQCNKGTAFATASCERDAIQNAVDLAVDGDTILVPKGNCRWISPVIINQKAITIQGAGIDQTYITNAIPKANPDIDDNPFVINSVEGKAFRITDFTFLGEDNLGDSDYGIIRITGTAKNWRVDHNKFYYINTRAIRTSGHTYGVIDNNIYETDKWATFAYIDHSGWNGQSFGDGSWSSPLSLGTKQAIFLENNKFNWTGGYPAISAVDCGSGGRFVARDNTFISMGMTNHGTETTGRGRSCFSYEIYDNIFNRAINQSLTMRFFHDRGGTGVLFNNRLTGAYLTLTTLSNYRDYNKFHSWDMCDGQSPYDLNDGKTYEIGTHQGTVSEKVLTDNTKVWTPGQWIGYSLHNSRTGISSVIIANTQDTITTQSNQYGTDLTFNNRDSYTILRAYPCLDQVGRSTGLLLSNYDPAIPQVWTNQSLQPFYEWNNTINGRDANTTADSPHIVSGRDYYDNVERPDYYQYPYPHHLVQIIDAPVIHRGLIGNEFKNFTFTKITMDWFEWWRNETTNFSVYTDEQLHNLANVRFSNRYGKIQFMQNLSLMQSKNLIHKIKIIRNKLWVNTTLIPEFNEPAIITFRNITFTHPIIKRNGYDCESEVCSNAIFDLSQKTFTVTVNGFSIFEVVEQCTDGTQNYEESGVDCGGVCSSCSSPPPLSGGSSSSSGSSGVSGVSVSGSSLSDELADKLEMIWFELEKKDIIWNITNLDFTKVAFKQDSEEKLAKFSIELSDEKPAKVIPADNVYKYAVATSDKVNTKAVVIQFKVNKTWLKENKFSDSDIVMSRYSSDILFPRKEREISSGGIWVNTPTKKVSSDDYYFYYESLTSGIGYLAIRSKAFTQVMPQKQSFKELVETAPVQQELTKELTENNSEITVKNNVGLTKKDISENSFFGKALGKIIFAAILLVIISVVIFASVKYSSNIVKVVKNIETFRTTLKKKKSEESSLIGYVLKELKLGSSDSEIETELIQSGWNLDTIDYILKRAKLVDYIISQREKQLTDGEIRQKLIAVGWDFDIVDKCFELADEYKK